MQLVAFGSQDLYLTGNPQITFFKAVYRRHSQFAMEYIELNFIQSNILFNSQNSTTLSCKIDRNADLLHDCYLVFDLPAIMTNDKVPFEWTKDVGTVLLRSVQLTLGGQIIDKKYGQWLNINSSISSSGPRRTVYQRMVNGGDPRLNYSGLNIGDKMTLAINAKRLYIPLNLFFCNNPGLSLPLIALQYTDAVIDIEFDSFHELYRIGKPLISPKELFSGNNLSKFNNSMLTYLNSNYDNLTPYNLLENVFTSRFTSTVRNFILANYIFLGDEERRKFAQISHEYLIDQVQRKTYIINNRGPSHINMNLLHPVKEIIWALQLYSVHERNDWYNFTKNTDLDSLNYYINITQKTKTDILWDKAEDYYNSNEIKDYIEELKADSFNINFNYENSNLFKSNFYSILNKANIRFNGHDRFEMQEYGFFEHLQLYKYHSGTGMKGIYIYSFALNPEDFQPSGTCNMSRINDQTLVLDIEGNIINEKYYLYLYGVNYNVFRVMGGIGQLVFAN